MEERFSYYGNMTPLDPDLSNTKGVYKHMLEELVLNAIEKIKEKIYSEVKSELSDLRKCLESEIKKQNENIKLLKKFKDEVEKDMEAKEVAKKEEELKKIEDEKKRLEKLENPENPEKSEKKKKSKK